MRVCQLLERGEMHLNLVHHIDEGLVRSHTRARLGLPYNICIYKERGDVPGICIYSSRLKIFMSS